MKSFSKRKTAPAVPEKILLRPGSSGNHRCKLCLGSALKSLYRDKIDAWICLDCCAVFITHPHGGHDIRKFYTSSYGDHLAFKVTSNRRIRRQLKWITRYTRPEASPLALEVGCANGQMLEALKNAGFQVFGIEPGMVSSMIAGAKIGHKNIFQGFLDAYETEKRFNLAILLHTFEHFENPMHALTMMHALLVSGGLLFLKVPNYYSFRGGFFRNWSSSQPGPSPNHAFVYTQRTLGHLVQRYQFELLESKSSGRSVRIVARKSCQARPESYSLPLDSPVKMLAFHTTAHLLANLTGRVNRIFQWLGIRRRRKTRTIGVRIQK